MVKGCCPFNFTPNILLKPKCTSPSYILSPNYNVSNVGLNLGVLCTTSSSTSISKTNKTNLYSIHCISTFK